MEIEFSGLINVFKESGVSKKVGKVIEFILF